MRKSTFVVLVIFILAVGALLFLQNSPNSFWAPTATPMATTAPVLLSGINIQDITMIIYKPSAGAETRLTRGTDGNWLTAESGDVPQGIAEQLLAELLATRIIVQMPIGLNLKDLLLDNPSQTITIQSTGGKSSIVYIGGLTPTQSGYYVKVDQTAAAVVDKSALDTILQLFSEAKPATATPAAAVLGPTATPKP
jgi:hypothetical protein